MLKLDLEGKKFNKLTVISFLHCKDRVSFWKCLCDCGNETILRRQSIISGHTKSCGCLQYEIKDITGQRFGRLTAISFKEIKNSMTFWNMRCDCGTIKEVEYSNLKRNTRSCGCLQKELLSKRQKTHGQKNTKTYSTWMNMKGRCLDPTNIGFKYYGGRGIKICERWMKFENFYKDMGDRPLGKCLDRINNNGNYQPDNCKWSTLSEQRKNRRNMKMPLSVEKYG